MPPGHTSTIGRHPPGQTPPRADTLLDRHLSLDRHPAGQTPPPWTDTPLGKHPLGRHLLGRHPLGRHTPGKTPPGQTSPGHTPLWTDNSPPAVDGAHPPGMHSCYFWCGQYEPSEIQENSIKGKSGIELGYNLKLDLDLQY